MPSASPKLKENLSNNCRYLLESSCEPRSLALKLANRSYCHKNTTNTPEDPQTSHTAFDRRMDPRMQPPPRVTHFWLQFSCRNLRHLRFTELES